jgi:hypothetical protein
MHWDHLGRYVICSLVSMVGYGCQFDVLKVIN